MQKENVKGEKKIMKTKEMKRRGTRGITLIALVVTIVVLLILAGITISTLTGDNGIITMSRKAKLETEIAEIAEKINLISNELKIENTGEQEQKSTMRYLIQNDYISAYSRKLRADDLLEKETSYGKGDVDKGDVYVIEANKVVYYNKDNEIEAEKEILLETIDFVTEWEIEAGDIFILPISTGYTGDNDFIVDWGDGSVPEYISDRKEVLQDLPQHQYTETGNYQISISGRCSYFASHLMSDEQRLKLKKIINWGDIEAVSYSFSGCNNLGGAVPSPSTYTFSDYGDDLYNMFDSTAIDYIPADLFKNMSEEATSFDGTFSYCYGLTEIPEGLFNDCVNAISFENVFRGCDNIEKVPTNLFDNCQKVTNFTNAFKDLDKVTELPILWTRTTGGLDGTGCYSGCDSLKNINEIPANWK